jgi:hypothetical protein
MLATELFAAHPPTIGKRDEVEEAVSGRGLRRRLQAKGKATDHSVLSPMTANDLRSNLPGLALPLMATSPPATGA